MFAELGFPLLTIVQASPRVETAVSEEDDERILHFSPNSFRKIMIAAMRAAP